MNTEEQAVLDAARRFYDAIEQLVSGKGLEAMRDACHHTERVTSVHPSGEWSVGWDEIFASWEVFAGFGRADRGGSRIRDLKAFVYGELAYTTCIFIASPAFGGESLPCTNVLHRVNGAWKVVHHHSNRSPKMEAALEKIAKEG
jgi:ketosteroid isomerase-like protein